MPRSITKEFRNSWRRYTSDMDVLRHSTPGLGALRQALEAGALDVHYQPLLTLPDGKICCVEALVRWTHAGASVPASEIVRLAEDSGLVVPLTEFVVRTAMRHVQSWDAQLGSNTLRLAVNVSAVQIHEGGLVDLVDRLLCETGFDARRLDIELTERAAMRASTSELDTLTALRDRGITLTLDDFGTGYSALSRLERLPIDAMKIDKSFLEQVEAGSGVIARAIIAMRRALDLRIIGEGVETVRQLAFLAREGCHCAQGFLLGQPMPAADLLDLLRDPDAVRGRFAVTS